jgi:GNAT superfamily N-acetyltransferase
VSPTTPVEFGDGREHVVSGIAGVEPDAGRLLEMTSWKIREATQADVPAVAAGVGRLLVELGGEPVLTAALEEAARALIDDPDEGVVLVAEQDSRVVGVLGVSWQIAIRVPGRYGLIQELWVHPRWRGRTIGGDLIVALSEFARSRGVTRVEVGLPGERHAHLAATEAFYTNNGFTTIGTRMRRPLR